MADVQTLETDGSFDEELDDPKQAIPENAPVITIVRNKPVQKPAQPDITGRPESQIAGTFNKNSRKLTQALKQNFGVDESNMDPMLLNMMNRFEFVTDPQGTFHIFRSDQNTTRTILYPNGGMVVDLEGLPHDSPEALKTQLESMAIWKAANNKTESRILNFGATEEEILIGVKTAELVGIKTLNPPARTLDEVNPELAKKMETMWAEMKAQNQIAAAFVPENRPTVSTVQP